MADNRYGLSDDILAVVNAHAANAAAKGGDEKTALGKRLLDAVLGKREHECYALIALGADLTEEVQDMPGHYTGYVGCTAYAVAVQQNLHNVALAIAASFTPGDEVKYSLNGWTPLIFAAARGLTQHVAILLDKGADINAAVSNPYDDGDLELPLGATALIKAVGGAISERNPSTAHIATAMLLLNSGAAVTGPYMLEGWREALFSHPHHLLSDLKGFVQDRLAGARGGRRRNRTKRSQKQRRSQKSRKSRRRTIN